MRKPIKENIEGVIRLAVRVQQRMRRDGIELRWQLSFVPCEPEQKAKRGKGKRGSNEQG